jgi:putative transcriptional regulator
MAYRYEDSGLDNIYLENGFTIHETPYGQGVSIEDTAGLHKTIGLWLVSLPKPLNGAELRFLRLEMDTTQRRLAAVLGTTEQTLRLWERHRRKAVPGPADRLLRALYSEYVGGGGSVRSVVNRLSQLDQIESAEARLCETDHGWEVVLGGKVTPPGSPASPRRRSPKDRTGHAAGL